MREEQQQLKKMDCCCSSTLMNKKKLEFLKSILTLPKRFLLKEEKIRFFPENAVFSSSLKASTIAKSSSKLIFRMKQLTVTKFFNADYNQNKIG